MGVCVGLSVCEWTCIGVFMEARNGRELSGVIGGRELLRVRPGTRFRTFARAANALKTTNLFFQLLINIFTYFYVGRTTQGLPTLPLMASTTKPT